MQITYMKLSTVGEGAFSAASLCIYNNLPDNTVSAESLAFLRRLLRTFSSKNYVQTLILWHSSFVDEKLFFLSRYNPNHVLHRLLPQPKNTGYNLRPRTHDLTLPTDINAVIKQNFVYRMLFRAIY